jgi:hypothetical protein
MNITSAHGCRTSATKGKVTGDMYVNRQYAESSEKGKRLINRLMR